MNWSKGFFRIWVVVSVLWAIFVAGIVLESRPTYSEYQHYMWDDIDKVARGLNWSEKYGLEKAIAEGRFVEVKVPAPKDYSVIFIASLDRSTRDDAMSTVDKKIESDGPAWRANYVVKVIGLLAAFPLGLLVVGLTIAWTIRGFRKPPTTGHNPSRKLWR